MSALISPEVISNVITTEICQIRKNLLGEHPPITNHYPLYYIVTVWWEQTNLRPIYQRQIEWKPENMNKYIAWIMNNGLNFEITIYNLHSDERVYKNIKYCRETIDGQHRLYTIKAFYDSTYRTTLTYKKKFIVYWPLEYTDEKGITHYLKIFYQETTDVIEFCKENKITPTYLSKENKDYFNNYQLKLLTITNKMSEEDRGKLFMEIQKSAPVRGSNLLKNTDSLLMRMARFNAYEEVMIYTFFDKCSKKANKYWSNWVCRMYLLYLLANDEYNELKKVSKTIDKFSSKDEQAEYIFGTDDKTYGNIILKNRPIVNPENRLLENFNDAFENYMEFIKKILCELNAIQMFALFYVSCDNTINLDNINDHIPQLWCEGKNNKKLWLNKDLQQCKEYFTKCVQDFKEVQNRPFKEIEIDNKPISKKLKKMIFDKCINGVCSICKHTEITIDNFEAGHIEARAKGGKTTIDNMLPMCKTCNNEMKTRNAYDFQREKYPQNLNSN